MTKVPSSGSSPRSEASHESTYLRSGNFDEIRAEFSRSKRRRLDAYRLIQKLKHDENLMMKNDLKVNYFITAGLEFSCIGHESQLQERTVTPWGNNGIKCTV